MDDELRSDVEKILRWFRGNGQPGVFERQRDLEARQERADNLILEMQAMTRDTSKKLDAVIKERDVDRSWRRGAAWAFGIIATLFGVAGSVTASRILRVLSELSNSAP